MLSTFIKFFDFAGKRKGKLIKGIVFAFLKSLFLSLQIMAIFVVLQGIAENQVTEKTVWISFGIMLISTIGNIFTNQKATMAQTEGSFYMCADKRTEIADRMKYMPMGYFNNNSLGKITSIVTSTMEDMQDIAPRVLDKTIHGLLHALILVVMLLVFDWRIGGIILIGLLLFLMINAVMQRKSEKVSPDKVKTQVALIGEILEYVQGMSVVRSFNMALKANKSIDKAIDECEKKNIGLEMAFIPFMFLQSMVLKLVSVVMMIVSVSFYLSGTMELSICMMMIISAFLIFSQLETAGSMSALLRVIDASIDHVEEIYKSPIMDRGGKEIIPVDHTICGENVSFSYDQRKIIDKVDFNIPSGTTTAIIGPSGSGKTTLCNLIARFWDIDSGSITVGGRDVREYSLDSLLSNFSMVFQNVYLFHDTIENNIKFGNPHAGSEEVRKAAKKACCDEFISRLPNGYQTVIGEGGATISGGEKQRISIARAILKDAPIIILDEATANVDPENESKLQKAIQELTKNKTILMIAHRLKTIKNADQILVLNEGKIIQRGTHSELMEQGGLYADFIGMRTKSIGWKLAKES